MCSWPPHADELAVLRPAVLEVLHKGFAGDVDGTGPEAVGWGGAWLQQQELAELAANLGQIA